jgi:2,3-bisphosphoglycerate-independent phosphoglycerate mutase
MYRGVAKLVGMDVLGDAKSFEDELDILESRWNDYDFFFLHFKTTDSRGEDGDFEGKVAAIESVDRLIPHITALKPDVLAITGDHSTPAIMRSHSWHPVPTLLWSPYCRRDNVPAFGERACMQGGLGPRIPSKQLMPLALANAQRLKKYGA